MRPSTNNLRVACLASSTTRSSANVFKALPNAEGQRTVRAGGREYKFDARGHIVGKAFGNPALNDVGTKPSNSLNGRWDNDHASTGASNSWRDQPEPSVRPTIVGNQSATMPNTTQRDAAVAAIKKDLARPKKAFGN